MKAETTRRHRGGTGLGIGDSVLLSNVMDAMRERKQ
jgi:hypothetical protein